MDGAVMYEGAKAKQAGISTFLNKLEPVVVG